MTNTDTTLTMSSQEIAGLTWKNHPDVMRDIRNMLAELGGVRSFADTCRHAPDFSGTYTG